MERAVNDNATMKKIVIPLMAATLLALPPVIGQPGAGVSAPPSVSSQISNLVKFDLEFPGGTPRQLVEAIEKASGKPLNAVIPDEDAGLRLPALKMRAVNVSDLFQALLVSSRRTVLTSTRGVASVEYGFSTVGNLSENSIWYFYQLKPDTFEEKKACRFYQLDPYLDTFKVEDITTAIQTGWKMLGETNPPTISFHKDTKLLIAVGDPSKLQLIDSVLQQLAQGKPQPQRESTGARTAEPAKK
jgi:hypothetical protein